MLLPVLFWAVVKARVVSEDVATCNKETEFDCGIGPHRCIPLEWICENVQDCMGGQDEGHCSYLHTCPVGSLICRDGTCISSTFKCDGNADCHGGSDEAGCAHAEALNISLALPHNLRHEIPQKLSWLDLLDEMADEICDGQKFKCPNGGPCIVAEAVCDGMEDCPNGEDEHDCSSSHRIENVVDDRQDVVECPRHMTSCVDRSVCIPTSWVCDGDMDCDDHSDEFDCDEDKSLAVEVQSNHHLCGYNEYRCSGSPAANPGISICDAGGFYCRQIIQGETSNEVDASKRQTYRGLALNPQHGKMFWIEGYNNVHRIRMANMDGTNVETVIDSKLEYPSGLVLDPIRGDLYFGDVEKEMIESVNIRTRERTVALTSGVHHPHDLAYFNGFLYWSHWGTESLKQQPNNDICESIGCPWICVAVPGSDDKIHPKCVCPENYSQDGKSCVPQNIDRQDVNVSRISVSLMQQLCAEKNACSKHGECESLTNEHDRVDRIICICQDGFEGDHCEIAKEFTLAAQEEDSSSSAWIVIFFCIVFLAAAAALFYCIYANVGTVGSPRCGSEELPTGVTNTFNNPMFAQGPASEYDEPSGSVAALATDSESKASFSNPLHSSVTVESVNGSPFSDYEVCYMKKVIH